MILFEIYSPTQYEIKHEVITLVHANLTPAAGHQNVVSLKRRSLAHDERAKLPADYSCAKCLTGWPLAR